MRPHLLTYQGRWTQVQRSRLASLHHVWVQRTPQHFHPRSAPAMDGITRPMCWQITSGLWHGVRCGFRRDHELFQDLYVTQPVEQAHYSFLRCGNTSGLLLVSIHSLPLRLFLVSLKESMLTLLRPGWRALFWPLNYCH